MSQDQLNHGLDMPVEEEIARDTRARQLQSSRLRIALFKALQVESQPERQAALEKIIQVVKSYMRLARSPFSPVKTSISSAESTAPTTPPAAAITSIETSEEAGCRNSHEEQQPGPTEPAELEVGGTDEQLQYFLLTILRLSITCPFSDVRQTFRELLQITMDTAIPAPQPSHLSPSYFIALKDIFSLESTTSYFSSSYPRPANLSFSPWSHEAESSDGMDEPFDVTKSQLEYTEGDMTGGRPSDEYVRQMMVKTFMEEGRLANLFRIMAFFPTFYEIYHTTYSNIVRAAIGPLHRTWKCYLGIMAAAEQRCQYLVSVLKLDFLQNGGDPVWLKGIEHCPPKLRHISGLVLKMARQPWRLSEEDITNLMSSSGKSLGESWSKGELVQAVLIISTFLGSSSFVLGCGITPELDMRGGYYVPGCGSDRLDGIEHELDQRAPSSPGMEEAIKAASSATGWHDSTIVFESDIKSERAQFSCDNGIGLGVSVDGSDTGDDEDDEDEAVVLERTSALISKLKSTKDSSLKEELQESFENMNLQEDVFPENTNKGKRPLTINTMASDESHDNASRVNVVHEDVTRFADPVQDQNIIREEFESDSEEYGEFMLGEYCWEDHGCDLVNHFLHGIGDDLDAEFNEALSITDWRQVADGAVDTSPLRYAIWFYVQKMLGVTKEDYNYSDIPAYLSHRTKEYIQKLCCRPHEIRRGDWNKIGISFRPEEKCHMNLLIASAKKQALLCYGLYLISQV
ncbi:Sestrin-1 [Apophysomyces sp. BC1034]|nr:Sestrin-1 [Apophysomyces sp. BC1015]KAG0178810.1 Sestrin-1 [Apophysomyces sp. BC1021]KAG0188705.1 Sestrin-1 [Apophysomyces sp. BC1034]